MQNMHVNLLDDQSITFRVNVRDKTVFEIRDTRKFLKRV